MADIGGHLSAKGAFVDTNNDGTVDGFAHTIKNAGNFNTFSLVNGVLTVQGPSGGTSVGGADTHVQFNDGGSTLNGESTFTYNKTTNTLNIANVIISGNLTVSGTTTTINTATLDVADNIITLNSDHPSNQAPTQNAGILVNRGSVDDAQFIWDETNDRWNFSDVGGTEHSLDGVGKVFAKGSGAVYTFSTDTDTGIEHTGLNQLGLLAGNSRILMVNADGVHIAPSGASGASTNQALRVDDIIIDTQTISTEGGNKNLILAPHGSGAIELAGVSSNATSIITAPSGLTTVGTSLTIQSGSPTAGGANNYNGGNLILAAGPGKGTGTGGRINFQTADGGSSGNTLNPLTTKMTILDSGFVGIAQNTPTVPLHVGGDAIISGNLTVSGTSTTVQTTNTFVSDEVLTLNAGETANGVSGGVAGFEIDRGENSGVDNTIARFIYDESDDKFKTQMQASSGSSTYNAAGIVASTIEGTSATLSGDLVVDTNLINTNAVNNVVGIGTAAQASSRLKVDGGSPMNDAIFSDGDLRITGNIKPDGGLTGFGKHIKIDKHVIGFKNNNASTSAIGQPLRIDGSSAFPVPQTNLAQNNTLANCAVGIAVSATTNGQIGDMAIAGYQQSIPASIFVGSNPSDGAPVYLSATAGKMTVDKPTTGFVQQLGVIQDTNVHVSNNTGTAVVLIHIGDPLPAAMHDPIGTVEGESTLDLTGDVTIAGNLTANGNILGDGATDITNINQITTTNANFTKSNSTATVITVRNDNGNAGSAIPKGAPVTIGNVAHASGVPSVHVQNPNQNSPPNARQGVGLAFADISNGAEGEMIVSGLLTQVSFTAFSNVGTSVPVGTMIYASASDVGKLSTARPTANNSFAQAHGMVIRSDIVLPHTSQGQPVAGSGTCDILVNLQADYNYINLDQNNMVNGKLDVGFGGTNATTAQDAINNLTTVATATAGHVLTKDGNGNATFQAATGGTSGITIQEEGSALSTAATTLNFVGSNITASGTGATKTITVTGGGGATAGYLTKLSGTNVDNTGFVGTIEAFAGFTVLEPHVPNSNPSGPVVIPLGGVVSGSVVLLTSFPAGTGGTVTIDATKTYSTFGVNSAGFQESFHLVFINTDGGNYDIASSNISLLSINGASSYSNNTQYSATSMVFLPSLLGPQTVYAWG